MKFLANILTLVLAGAAFAQPAGHHPKWVMAYTCDSGWGELADDVCGEAARDYTEHFKTFPSKQEAIDWINENYMFAPTHLRHETVTLECWFSYIDMASEDAFRAHQKEVECDTPEQHRKEVADEADTISNSIESSSTNP